MMPFVDQNPTLMRGPEGIEPLAPRPTLDDTVAAAFRQDNTVINLFRRLKEQEFPPEPDYNPINDIRDTKYLFDHGDNFVNSRSSAETRAIMRRIDGEEADRRTLAASGVAGFVAQIAAGTIDPTLALPAGVVVRSVRGGYSVGRTARSTGRAAGAQAALQEGVLQATQETRTAGESAVSVASATLLGGLIGAGAVGLLTRAERNALERALDADRAAMDAHAGNPPPQSGGAAATNEPPRAFEQEQSARPISLALDNIGERGSEWVDLPEGRIYLRAGQRPGIGRTLEIPNIEFDEAARGKGAFTRYLTQIEREASNRGFDGVYVEQIFNERLEAFLRRRGYRDEPSDARLAGINIGRDQATLYKPIQSSRVFMADEPYRLSTGKSELSETEQSAADVLSGTGNNYPKALREVNEMIQMQSRASKESPRSATAEVRRSVDGKGWEIWNKEKDTLWVRGHATKEEAEFQANMINEDAQRSVGHAAAVVVSLQKWEDVLAVLRDWQRDKVTIAGRMVTEEERDLLPGRVAAAGPPTGGGGSVGAAATDTRQLEMFQSIPGTAFVSPTRRTMEAASVEGRRVMADLAELPYRFQENEAGVATSQGPSVERLARMEMNGTRVQISDELQRQFSDYRYGQPDKMLPGLRARVEDITGRGDGKLSYHDFKQEVPIALQNEDRHAIPQVSNAALYIRQKLLDPWAERAEQAIAGFERNVPKEGESYYPHVWNKTLIRARRPEFVNKLVDKYQTDQIEKRAAQQRLEFMNAQLQSWQDQIAKLEARFGRAEERAKKLDVRAAERSRDDMPKTAGMNEPEPTGRVAELQVQKAVLQAEAKDLADAADLVEELLRQNPTLQKVLDKTIRAIEAKGRKIDITAAKHGEAGRAAKRSEKRLAALEEQLSKTEERQQLIEDYIVVAQQMHDEVRAKIEAEIGAWNGKSASDAKSALKAREQYDIERKAKAAAAGQPEPENRLKSADDAIDRTVKRILANDYERGVDELRDRAQQTADRILGSPDGRLPYDEHLGGPRIGISNGSPPPRGSLAQRSLDVTNAWARDWLENDVERVVALHLRTMVPDVLLAERFGDVEMSDAFRRIHESYARIIDQTKAEKTRTRLGKERDAVIRDVAAVRDRIRGIFGWSPDMQNMARVANAAKNINNLTSMGVAAVSSLSDAAGTLIRYGLQTGLQDGWTPFIRSMLQGGTEEWGKFKTEMRAIGIGVETAINARQHALDDVMDVYRPHNRFERALQATSDKFFIANLLAPETDMFKLISAHVSVSNILRATKAAHDGKATRKQIGNLAESGIDQNMAGRIWQQFVGNGGNIINGVHLPNTKDWLDRAAADALNGAVARDVDIMVVTPGQEKPLWMSKPVISLLGQFKAFTASSTERILIANLQRRDAAALSGLVASLGLGIMSYKLNSFFGGQKTSDRPQDWVKEGISRAGLLGWFEEGNALASKASRGSVDIYRMIGADKPLSRFVSRSAADMLLGPTWGKIEALPKLTGSAFAGDWSAADTTALRRLVAGQNLFYVRGLLNQVEQSVNSRLDIPERKEPPTRH
jgi:hypothetical protein